jgi:shikimate kinase
MKNIYLVGFMGTGKTVVAEALAKRLKKHFLEMDQVIEDREKMSIVDIFRLKGESYFRDRESKLLRELALQNNLVVSCGGGVMCKPANVKLLKSSGTVIALTATPEVIYRRIKDQTHRPLLNVADPLKEISNLLLRRREFYQQAHRLLETDHLSVSQVAEKIAEAVDNG